MNAKNYDEVMIPSGAASESAAAPALITLLGKWTVQQPWTLPCLKSWHRLLGTSGALWLVSDGTLGEEEIAQLRDQLPGLKIRVLPEQEQRVAEALAPFPALAALRKDNLVWRKLIDFSLTRGPGCDSLLCIDTDVFVRRPAALTAGAGGGSLGMIYMREESPSYHGKWRAAFREPMVLACNSGFLLFQPETIELAFLDYIVRNYLQDLPNYWWSEQFAWSMLAGRSTCPRYWEGASASVITGLLTRTPREILENRVKFLSGRTLVKNSSQILDYCGDIPVVHLAGMAKRFINAVLPGSDADEPALLKTRIDRPLRLGQNSLSPVGFCSRRSGRSGVTRVAPGRCRRFPCHEFI